MNRYLVEYMGALVITYAVIFSHENPLLVGFAHTSVLYIAKSLEIEGQFTPLATICHILLNRIDFYEALKILATHILAAFSIVLVYQKKTLM